jgi:hypothetical protein
MDDRFLTSTSKTGNQTREMSVMKSHDNQGHKPAARGHGFDPKKDHRPIGIRSVAAAAEMVKHPKTGEKAESARDIPAWMRDEK